MLVRNWSPHENTIHASAHTRSDGIDLISLPFASAAFASIEIIQRQVPADVTSAVNGSRIDTHGKLAFL
jgi:hypothetical protein